MASNLRVDTILPSTGTSLGIGTANGTTTVTGNLGVSGVLTYEDVTNIDSVGVITARSGIRIGATGANTLITGNGTGIGIGITTPQEELHIRAATPVIRLEDGDNARQSQIVGSDGNLRFDADNGNAIANTNISFRTDGSERLRIHSNGLVTAPFQYHLHAERSNNQTGYNAQGDFGVPMIFNNIVSETKDSSLSSCFNTSTGVFTAPVLGLYIFNASALSSGNNVFSQSWFTLNGSRAAATDWHNGQTSHSITQNTQVIRLAAGNTVGFKPYAAGQSSLTLNSNSNHTYLKVTLIG